MEPITEVIQITNIWALLGLAFLLIAGVIKHFIDNKSKRQDRFVMETLAVHIQKQSNVLDVILKQYSSNVNEEQMEKIYDWVFFQTYTKIFTLSHNIILGLRGGIKLSNNSLEHKIIQEINNIYDSDLKDLSKFKFQNVGLDKYISKEDIDKVINVCIEAVESDRDLRQLREHVDTLSTSHKLKAIKLAKEDLLP